MIKGIEDEVVSYFWMPVERKVTIPEWIKGTAKGRMKRENGVLFEITETTWGEYRAALNRVRSKNQ